SAVPARERQILRAECWLDTSGIRLGLRACRSGDRRYTESLAYWSVRLLRPVFRGSSGLRERERKENRDPTDHGVQPENAKCAHRFRHLTRSRNWRTGHHRCDHRHKNRMRLSQSECKPLRVVRRAPCQPNCWRLRWFSKHLSAKYRNRIHPGAESCGTTSEGGRCEPHTRGCPLEEQVTFQDYARPL